MPNKFVRVASAPRPIPKANNTWLRKDLFLPQLLIMNLLFLYITIFLTLLNWFIFLIRLIVINYELIIFATLF